MTASVAIATYNGEKYIIEQLESILRQTRQPDDVVICDDGSTDKTIKLIEKFINDEKLSESWVVVRNKERLGCDKNFVECAKKTRGNIIFFADQDDVWRPNKIERMMEVFQNHPNAYGVTCRSDLVDSSGKVILKLSDKFTVKRTDRIVKYSLAEQIKYNRSAGLELAFRRDLLNDLEQIVNTHDVKHDQPVGMIACLKGEYYGLNEILLSHRIHDDNLSAPRINVVSRIRRVSDQIEGNEEHLKHMRAFEEMFKKEIPVEKLEELEKAITMTELSIDALKKKKCYESIRLLCQSNRMINKWIFVNNTMCIAFGDYGTINRNE